MNNKPLTFVCLLATTLLFGSCKKGKTENIDNLTSSEAIAEVDTITLRKQVFKKQLLCNGKLSAIKKADLQWDKPTEILQAVYVVNGQRVAKGTLLGKADSYKLREELDKARHDLEKATVDLQDKLISLGYAGSMDNVPADVRHKAEIVSGYYTAKYQLRLAQRQLAECEFRAPFSGRIANIKARANQPCTDFATLIDDSEFNVEFKILEAELAFVKPGMRVSVCPYVYSDDAYSGVITEVNPMVDDKGMVGVTARVANASAKLMDGMNVKITVEQDVPDMFVVPKSAVVERDGYNVVFVYDKHTKRAVWTYVDILHSNLRSHAITGCESKNTTIKSGDVVITSGNLNLADDTEVRIASGDKGE